MLKQIRREERGAEQIHIYNGNVFAPKDSDPIIASYNTWVTVVDDGWVVD